MVFISGTDVKKIFENTMPEFDADDPSDALAQLRNQRLLRLLEILEKQGISQKEAARRTGVPSQYLNDVKSQRRSLSERFARRLQDEFHVNYQWLLGTQGSMEVPRLDLSTGQAGGQKTWLPVFAHPIAGDPYSIADWDGSTIEIAGVAITRARRAEHPYALRFGATDQRQRLRPGDLLLVSQATNDSADIQVIRSGNKCNLARQRKDGTWECLNAQVTVRGEPTVIGHVLGILWGAL
jgi:transcriptional regulator with XRE-family HTH domain